MSTLDDTTPDWIAEIVKRDTGPLDVAKVIDEIEYAASVLAGQTAIILKMLDDLRKFMVAQDIIQEK